ncbi:hypothetical protein FA09DRAFT_329622 [Tilletiopsis washingtonensis]|uniref:DUF6924 domain-containing protein n=1 Tax=Tilletiopsis washingtonensis TaxID=58919 RepID=A0A316ZAG4_9BASI|nr:hypothetical protein FA09DRAFT_329622 [Tilletiopsis washingtonensis]PWN98571.1 hypothetical protein FA09DRAFT_329622 [Tilletiopsis washingtonensis]
MAGNTSPLFNASSLDDAELLARARASSFIDESMAGDESSREESGLWNVLRCVPAPNDAPTPQHIADATAKLDAQEWTTNVAVLADERTAKDDSVLVVALKDGKVHKTMRTALASVIEVVCNVQLANMPLEEYIEWKGDAEVFDSRA